MDGVPSELIGAAVVLIIGCYLGWVIRGEFLPHKEVIEEQKAIEIKGDCPIISWEHIKGHVLVFERLTQFRIGERRLWIAQAYDSREGALAFYVENTSLALDLQEVKRNSEIVLVENDDETISIGRL